VSEQLKAGAEREERAGDAWRTWQGTECTMATSDDGERRGRRTVVAGGGLADERDASQGGQTNKTLWPRR
jgi:hypothetical protein